MKKIKQFIIRWAVKQLKYLNEDKGALTYEKLSDYGIADILVNEHTGERAYYLDKIL